MKFRFHVVGLPHTVCSKEYVPCAYTQKVLNFCKMMKSLGHTVFHYGGEGSNPECDEHISIITYEQRKKWWGENDWRKQLFKIDWDPSLEYWQAANSKAVEEISRRIQRQDFICLIGGNCQKPIADQFPNHMSVEFGVGYEGVFSNYRVFESYAHMHYVYGMLKQWAKNYDEVIPNYFDPADFPFSKEKDDYFLFVGRLISSKGPHIAAEMVNALGARLLVAGQGVKSYTPGRIVGDDIEIVGPRIEYVGTVDVQRRGELMSRAKALILPTQYIGPFEGVTVEAMMCGTPVITTDWGVYNETVIDGVTGFRTRTLGEMVGAARAVGQLDPETIRKWAVDHYSIDVVRYHYEDYFTRLYQIWGRGWYDLSYTGSLKRSQGGFSRGVSTAPVEERVPAFRRTYLEIGTSDFSTLAERFRDRPDWHGISVEAVPEYFDRLPPLQEKNCYLNAVCVTDDRDEVDFHYVTPWDIQAHSLPDWLRGCGSENPDQPSLKKYQEFVRTKKLPTIHVRELVKGKVDLLKLDTEGQDYRILTAVLDLGSRPTHIIFEHIFMTEEQIEELDTRLSKLGYEFRGFFGDNMEYARPSVLLVAEERWSTGTIAKDLRELSSWSVDILDWKEHPATLQEILGEYDAVLSFVLPTPHIWRELKDHGVICCNSVDIHLLEGKKPVGKCFGAVSVDSARALSREIPNKVWRTIGSARLGRFARRTDRPIETLGWCSRLNLFHGKDIKRHGMFQEICTEVFLPGRTSNEDYVYENMQQFYDSVDLLICTSSEEGGPLGLFEAIACGVPVISTDVGLAKEVSSIWKFSSVEEAVALIEKLKDPRVRKRYCNQQYKQLRETFSMEQQVGRWEEFFGQCVHQKTSFSVE